MKRDFYSYAKLELLDTARLYVACNEGITLEQRTDIINSINEEYVQTVNEARGIEFKPAQEMIEDISTSFDRETAMDIIMQKLFCENYAFQDEIYEFAESTDFVEYFDKATIYDGSEEVSFDSMLDNIIEKSKTIAKLADGMNFSM